MIEKILKDFKDMNKNLFSPPEVDEVLNKYKDIDNIKDVLHVEVRKHCVLYFEEIEKALKSLI